MKNILTLLTTLLLVPLAALHAADAPAKKPNFVVILSDDQTYRAIGYKNPAVKSPFMDTLDFPDLGLLAPSRSFSASSLQSLALYNNSFVLHFSSELGKQITTPAEAIRRILLREPTADELRDFTAYAQKTSLAALCRVLINSNEFLFVN